MYEFHKRLSRDTLNKAYHEYMKNGKAGLLKMFPGISEKDLNDLISFFMSQEEIEKKRKESKARYEKANDSISL